MPRCHLKNHGKHGNARSGDTEAVGEKDLRDSLTTNTPLRNATDLNGGFLAFEHSKTYASQNAFCVRESGFRVFRGFEHVQFASSG